MIRFILLVFILVTLYWVSMIESISSIILINSTEKAPFAILVMSTEHENVLRVKPIAQIKICFLFEIDLYLYD